MNVGLRDTEKSLELLPEVTETIHGLSKIGVKGNLTVQLKDFGDRFWGKATGTALKSSSGVIAEGETIEEVTANLVSAVEEQVYPVKVSFKRTPEKLYKEDGKLLKGIAKSVADLHKLDANGTIDFEIKDLGGHRFSVTATGTLVNGKKESTNLSPEKAVADIVSVVKTQVHNDNHKYKDIKRRERRKASEITAREQLAQTEGAQNDLTR